MAFGYDVGVISGSLADMASTLDLSTLEQEAATSGLNFLAGFGALLVSGNLLDRLGRRATLLISSLLLLAGAAVVWPSRDLLGAAPPLQGQARARLLPPVRLTGCSRHAMAPSGG